MLDEREQSGIRPMHVLEDQDEWPHRRDRLDELAPRAERFPPLDPFGVGVGQADQRCETRVNPPLLGGVLYDGGDGGDQLLVRLPGSVRAEDPGLGLHDLPEAPEGHPFPVREASALPPRRRLRKVVDVPEELGHETALPDARFAHQRDELHGGLTDGARERPLEQLQLVVSVHPRRRHGSPQIGAEPAPRALREPHGEGIGFPFHSHGPHRLEVEHRAGEPIGPLPDQDPPGRRRTLESRGRVDHIAEHHPLSRRTGSQVDDRLPRLDAQSHRHGDLRLLVHLFDHREDPKSAEHGPFRVVLVNGRNAVDGQHGITHELLDGPAEPLDLSLDTGEEVREGRAHILRVGEMEALRGIHEIAEEDRDDTPFLTVLAPIPRRPELGTARRAVAGRVGARLAADRAGGHGWSVCRPLQQVMGARGAARSS